MKSSNLSDPIESIRQFNRFYTKQIGVLNQFLLNSRFSLAEARVIYELAARGSTTATELCSELSLDAGYLSRILKSLDKLKVIEKRTEAGDARKNLLSLSEHGRAEFKMLDNLSRVQVKEFLQGHSRPEQSQLLAAMRTIHDLLGPGKVGEDRSFILRQPNPGDLGWVVQSNGSIYADEYGWDETYEALVAQIVADFVKNCEPTKERCWIAERNGENVGSVFLVKQSASIARLRLLIVDPKARGLGIGNRLVDECTRFARQAGYKKIVLWTQSILVAARKIYSKAGYKLVGTEKNRMFGKELVSETCELTL
jgi:DNA-binding MarR family transcriptional regulator/GNAT superfamily N-acetyltransferase